MARRLSLLVMALGALILGLPSAAAGGGCHAGPDVEMSSSTSPMVHIGECAFQDTVTYVQPGDSVTWINKDPVPHSVTGAANSWGDEEFLNRTDRVTYKFEDEGVFPYYCVLHPSMVGAVVVGDATATVGSTGAGVKELDLASGATTSDRPTDDASGAPVSAVTGLSLAAALVAVVMVTRLMLRRRAGATPTA